MSEIIDLSAKRKPVTYSVHITHHWDGTLEIFVEDANGDERSRASIADAMRRAADVFDNPEYEAVK